MTPNEVGETIQSTANVVWFSVVLVTLLLAFAGLSVYACKPTTQFPYTEGSPLASTISTNNLTIQQQSTSIKKEEKEEEKKCCHHNKLVEIDEEAMGARRSFTTRHVSSVSSSSSSSSTGGSGGHHHVDKRCSSSINKKRDNTSSGHAKSGGECLISSDLYDKACSNCYVHQQQQSLQQFSSTSSFNNVCCFPHHTSQQQQAATSRLSQQQQQQASTSSADIAAQRAREGEARRKAVARDVALGFPAPVLRPEAFRYGKNHSHQVAQHSSSELTRNYIKPPPNKTVHDCESPPPYFKSSADQHSPRTRSVASSTSDVSTCSIPSQNPV